MTFNLALNLVQNDCNYHSHCIIFQYCIFIFVLPRSPRMCLVFIHYGYHIGEKEKCNSNHSLSLTNTFGLLSRPRPIILTKADARSYKLIANTTPHSTSCIQHISTCLFHKKALQGSSQLWAVDHCIGTSECKHQSPVTFYTIRSPSVHNCSSISMSIC
jgi:hypothetical protein